jgi:oligosaccharyltransferase complex subunit epsilon
MAPRRNAREGTPSVTATPRRDAGADVSQVTRAAQSTIQNAQETFVTLRKHYVEKTEPRIKQVDAFLAFLVVGGGIQFLYCLLFGTYVRGDRDEMERIRPC